MIKDTGNPRTTIVLCPIINKEITEEYCFDSAMVAEGCPPRFGVKEIVTAPNFKERCLACPNHKE